MPPTHKESSYIQFDYPVIPNYPPGWSCISREGIALICLKKNGSQLRVEKSHLGPLPPLSEPATGLFAPDCLQPILTQTIRQANAAGWPTVIALRQH